MKIHFTLEDFSIQRVSQEIKNNLGSRSMVDTAITSIANKKLKEILAVLESDLLCYSTGASVLSEDKIKEWFE
jgi:chaperone required for assembly of F1-ATPase